MLKKVLFFIVTVLCIDSFVINKLTAQTSNKNLTKYWWFRYRLVNDFMKIGSNCGESLPALKRHFSSWDVFNPTGYDPNPNDTGIAHLEWGDATTYLGQ